MSDKSKSDAQEMLEKYDRESQFRINIGKWTWVVTFLGVALTVFHLYVGYFGTLPSQKQGAVHLGTALGVIFLLFPIKGGLGRKQNTVPAYDVILAFTAMFVTYYKIMNYDAILQGRISGYSTFEIILSILGVLLFLEATRRTVGLPIVIVAASLILYALLGEYIATRMLSYPGVSYDRISTSLWVEADGTFSNCIYFSSKVI